MNHKEIKFYIYTLRLFYKWIISTSYKNKSIILISFLFFQLTSEAVNYKFDEADKSNENIAQILERDLEDPIESKENINKSNEIKDKTDLNSKEETKQVNFAVGNPEGNSEIVENYAQDLTETPVAGSSNINEGMCILFNLNKDLI